MKNKNMKYLILLGTLILLQLNFWVPRGEVFNTDIESDTSKQQSFTRISS